MIFVQNYIHNYTFFIFSLIDMYISKTIVLYANFNNLLSHPKTYNNLWSPKNLTYFTRICKLFEFCSPLTPTLNFSCYHYILECIEFYSSSNLSN